MTLSNGMCTVKQFIRNNINALGLSDYEASAIISSITGTPLGESPCDENGTYEFGKPHYHAECVTVGSMDCFHPIGLLVHAIYSAFKWMDEGQFNKYIAQLSNENKHVDFLTEPAPLLFATGIKRAWYEKPLIGNGGRNIEWALQWSSLPMILLEVKNRISITLLDFVQKMEPITSEVSSSGVAVHPAALFRSVEEKFRSNAPHDTLQGVWINIAIKQPLKQIEDYFRNIDSSRIHFVIFNTLGNRDSYVLCRASVRKELIIQRFGLNFKEDFLY